MQYGGCLVKWYPRSKSFGGFCANMLIRKAVSEELSPILRDGNVSEREEKKNG